MKICFSTLLFFAFFYSNAQDRFLKRDLQDDTGSNVEIQMISRDTLFYKELNVAKKIATKEVVAMKENYKEKGKPYHYFKATDERLFGIMNDQLFYKADYRFTTSNQELAKECFLAKFRVYDEDVPHTTDYKLFVCNDSVGEKVKIPETVKFYISLKEDRLNRNIQARLYHTTADTSWFLVKIEANETNYIYRFRAEDLKAIGIESAGARAGKIAVDVLSKGRSMQYSTEKWFTRYELNEWHICR